jgi:hypothetical protein
MGSPSIARLVSFFFTPPHLSILKLLHLTKNYHYGWAGYLYTFFFFFRLLMDPAGYHTSPKSIQGLVKARSPDHCSLKIHSDVHSTCTSPHLLRDRWLPPQVSPHDVDTTRQSPLACPRAWEPRGAFSVPGLTCCNVGQSIAPKTHYRRAIVTRRLSTRDTRVPNAP